MELTRDSWLHDRATAVLQGLYGANAQFRPGQYEAIEAALTHKRTLVVQRTGWGKSLVYFVATKVQREFGLGLTLVVSPLISLMDNQLDAARNMGLSCEVLNGSVDREQQRPSIIAAMESDTVDLVFITPETLFASDVQATLPRMRVGLFVIDEAHCISDWGHDFRLEYTRLLTVLAHLKGTPLLATTATATDAVVDDICEQLGGDVYVSRGPLVRDSLSIQVVRANSAADKYAWLLANLPQMPGSGIVYCTTTHDCDRLAEFLNENGISARSYHSKRDGLERTETLGLFNANEVKALVATSALGMGYDKDDIAFVVHFQLPSGIVAYYQQIGRAGRKLDRAYAILLYGDQTDIRIQEHFISSAFPTEQETLCVMELLQGLPGGLRFTDLLSNANMRRSRLNKALEFLQNDGFVTKDGPRYRASPTPFAYNRDHYEAITARRFTELQEMVDFAEAAGCYSQLVVRALGDVAARACGHCANCAGHDVFDMLPSTEEQRKAAHEFIDRDHLLITPRKRWPNKEIGVSMGYRSSVINPANEEGLCLTRLGWGRYGRAAKAAMERNQPFATELVEYAAQVLGPYVASRRIAAIVPVPSLRSPRVRDFAERVSARLGLPMVDALTKVAAPPQSDQLNSYYQCANVCNSVFAAYGTTLPYSVLLVDDTVDSGWTLTVCGSRLRESGTCRHVYPFVIADASTG
jgi:ATP-dependent DNA helicase RecQ